MRWLCLLLSLVLLSGTVSALDKPQRGRQDQRVLYADYKVDEVYPIEAVNGLITTIEFAPGEKVSNYGSGFSTAWEFASRANHFFLKPKAKQGTTNLVVVTNMRTYLFDVRLTGNRKKATYRLTFRYPMEEQAKAVAEAEKLRIKELLSQTETGTTVKEESKAGLNHKYSMNFGSSNNSKRIAPLAVFDDGRFTYLKFGGQNDFPAAYRKVDDEETMINSHVEGNWLVLHGVFEEMRLRVGKSVVGIYNENFSGGGSSNESAVSVRGLKRELTERGTNDRN